MTSSSAPPPRATVARVARGTQMTALSQVVVQVTRFATSIVLARILAPRDFGVLAIALVVTSLMDQLMDAGTGSAIIQRREVSRQLLDTVFALNLVLGTAMAALVFVTAGPIAGLLHNPQTEAVLRAMAFLTLVGALGQIHHSLLRRHLQFGKIALIAACGAIANAIVAVTCALFGVGVWALVLGVAAQALLGTLMVWAFTDYLPRFRIDRGCLRSIMGYSLNLFGTNMLYFAFGQADKVLVARFLGAAPLGIYSMALRTVTYPVQSLGNVVAEVVFPAFSRHQDNDETLRTAYVRASRAIALVTFPLMFGLAAVATPATMVVLGPRWTALPPLIWVLAPVGALQSVTLNSGHLLLAKGRTDLSLRVTITTSIVTLTAEVIGLRGGLQGLAIAYALACVALAPFILIVAFRTIGMPLRDYLKSLAPQTAITAMMVGLVLSSTAWVRTTDASHLVELLVGVGVGVCSYGALLALLRPPALGDALTAVRHREEATSA